MKVVFIWLDCTRIVHINWKVCVQPVVEINRKQKTCIKIYSAFYFILQYKTTNYQLLF